MLNGQFEGLALVSYPRKLRADVNPKELKEAGQNNSSLTLKATSVVAGEWELF
jgi:hypothetical protein